ncbi:MAG: DUF2236 domain-containing protein [Chloroflexi bacterium]|nr:DUF2236 domain-containing protein [Chloroflexota bacterium]
MSPRWTDEFLDAQRFVADAPADAVIAGLVAASEMGVAQRVLRTLTLNDQPIPGDLPQPAKEYLLTSRDLPPWAEPDKIRRGEHLYQRYGMQIGMLLFCSALAEGYLVERFARVLFRTAQLESNTQRRVVETGQLVTDAMAPGGLEPGGRGITSALRVRLMHASIRRLIKEQAKVDPESWPDDWGEPISQGDMAATLMAFSVLMLDGLKRLGTHLDAADEEAYCHCWRVVGYFMGIHEELLPNNVDESHELLASTRRRLYNVSPEGLALEAALIALLEEMSPGPMKHIPREMIRFLIGNEYADLLRVSPERGFWRRVFGFFIRTHRAGMYFVSETRLANIAEPFNRALLRGLMGRTRGGTRPPFEIPTELQEKWGLSAPAPTP